MKLITLNYRFFDFQVKINDDWHCKLFFILFFIFLQQYFIFLIHIYKDNLNVYM